MANESTTGWVAALKAMVGGKRQALVGDAEGASAAARAVGNITWTEFQGLVAEAFRQQGCTLTEPSAQDAQEGIDLLAHKEQQTLLVQSRHWKTASVGVTEVREMADTVAIRGAAGGYVLSSGRFTAAAVEYAKGKALHLVDGGQLLEMLRAAKAAEGRRLAPWEPGAPDATSSWFMPQCPMCSSPMQLQMPAPGASDKGAYWLCTQAPTCKGTRAMQAS
jgi:restriction system protein